MKITVYTTTDCQYSKQERDYLTANNLQYEEKNLETNKEFLTEMLAISNNFAGTPVTRVEKDDGSIVVLKGFTKGEFDTTFGFAAVQTAPAGEPTKVEEPKKDEGVKPPPVIETPSVSSPVTADKAKSDELNSVLDKLEEKTTPEATPPTEVPPVEPIPANSTSSTNSTDSQPAVPSIPDLPDAAKTTA